MWSRYLCLFFVAALFPAAGSFATHLRAGEITAERINCSSLTFLITLTIYVDTESGVPVGSDENLMTFGDGTSLKLPNMTTIPRPDLGEHMGVVVFTTTHTYSAITNSYTITYREAFRNNFVLNMRDPGANHFYLETTIFLDPFLGCNRYLPKLAVAPIDRACSGAAFSHTPAAYDHPDERDSISYSMSVPKRAVNTPVVEYKDPTEPPFYLNHGAANEAKNGVPTLVMNPVSGIFVWDAPGYAGEYNIAFHITEWRRDPTGVWRKISIITRDMQIVVDDCDNSRPDLILPKDTCVVAGTTLNETIFGTDPENHPVKIEVFSEVLHQVTTPATYTPRPAVFQPSTPPAQLRFSWTTDCDDVSDQYYNVTFKITDNPGRDTKLVTFRTWRIRVVGPPPVWQQANVDFAKRHATVQWDPYVCANAMQMQVWRKVDGASFTPGHCETGMPPSLGYSLVATVPLATAGNRFTDTNGGKGLAPGARYCYRLVAVYRKPGEAESYVSEDICLDPILADAPVITHATVEKTHTADGAIRASWYSPFQLSRTQYPGPYEYEVYRARGLEGTDIIRVTPASRITDTTFVDASIDTEREPYNYRIVLYSNTYNDPATWVPVDTSSVASSVWLKARGTGTSIALEWTANVPWSNESQHYPYNLVYRGDENTEEADFTLIDSVLVAGRNFAYVDEGRYQNAALEPGKRYCYRVLTRGVYGNPDMKEPFENFSQRVCIKPDAVDRPCAPALALTPVDCDEVFYTAQCLVNEFSNKIHWNASCRDDVRSYRIYVSADGREEFRLLAENVTDTFYVDKNLPSFARCYRVASVDRQGVESEQSEMICSDNCPYFELPNIFTPNGDDCNELFSAYGPHNPVTQSAYESCLLSGDNYTKCIRFVDAVSFKVYNRWGKEVFNSDNGPGEASIYVNWDGKDNDGQWLTSGVYYYQANVTFNTLDPKKRSEIYHGWVQLVR